jgi:hypothetical protein
MNRKMAVVFAGAVVSGMLAPNWSQAAGSIQGTVVYEGAIPPPKAFLLSKFPNTEFCRKNDKTTLDGKERLLTKVEVGKGGGLQGAVVAVRDITDVEWMKAKPQTGVRAERCEWHPATGIVVNRGAMRIENHDADPTDPKAATGVLHNPHAFEVLGPSSTTLFNVGLAQKGDATTKTLILRKEKRGGVVRLQCDQHEFMQAWFLPVTNPLHAATDADGGFEIKAIPAGMHTVAAWHPVLGLIERKVEVKDDEVAIVQFELGAK